MNIIISNKFQSLLQNLEIETLKTLNGVFSVDDIISQFKVMFFQRMILDITAIKDYKNIENLQKLAISLDADKIILLLDNDEESSSNAFQSKLISMGIYNFTNNLEGVNYLYNHPNTYRDVAHIQQLDAVSGAPEPAKTVVETQYHTQTVYVEKSGPKVIGVKNITQQSGATSLIYMMLNQLKKHYSVVAIELDKRDFTYFPDNDKLMFSKTGPELGNFITEHHDKDVILVDLNNSPTGENLCSDILYLIEPSVIKLNKYMLLNPRGLTPFKDKKIVINQSLLSQKDILDFEYESRLKVFYNMPPLDERESNIYILNVFLVMLGFTKQEDVEVEKKKRTLFGR